MNSVFRSIPLALTFAFALGACASTEEAIDNEEGAVSATLPKTKRSLERYRCPSSKAPLKIAYYDADSTLRVSKKGAVTPEDADDVDILPYAAKHIKRMKDAGYLVAIVSNQGGIAAGKQTFAKAESGLERTVTMLAKLKGNVDYFDFAEALDEFRKPEIGMAEALEEAIAKKCAVKVDRKGSFMVGDSGYKKDVDGNHPDGRPADDFSNSDRLFAENLEIPFTEPEEAFGWENFRVHNVLGEAELITFLRKMDEARASFVKKGDTFKAKEIEKEIADIKSVNRLK